MQQIREFMDQTEALMARDYLLANGITSDLQGVKDYSTHVVGGTQGRYFLSVDETDVKRAQDLLRQTNAVIPEQIAHPTEISEVALKKAVMYAVMAIVLMPVLGNWISIREATIYARLERSHRKWLWLTLISWLQVPGVLVAWILFKMIFSSFTGLIPV